MYVLRMLVVALLMLNSAMAGAEIFKWTDEKGNVHYGDKPKKNSTQVEVSEKNLSGELSTDESRAEKRRRLIDAMVEDREKKEQAEAKQRKKEQARKARCVRARDRMKSYQRANRLYRLDENGNRIILSDVEREKSTQHLQSQIDKYCK